MLSTENIGLKKPGYNDEADIAVINENSDVIDREFGNRYLKSETYSVEQANNAIAQAIEALPNGLVYRGAVNYYKDLPTDNNELGDTYSVKYQGETGTTADGNEYAWGECDGTLQWIKLGVNAYTKDEIDEQHRIIKSDILSAENDIAINRATLGTQKKNLIDQSLLLNASGWTVDENEVYSGMLDTMYAKFSNEYPTDISFKEKTSYTFSCQFKANAVEGNLQALLVNVEYTDGTTSTIITTKESSDFIKYTGVTDKNKTIKKIKMSYMKNRKGYIKEMQLEEGTVATAYEPYVPSVNERLVEVEKSVIPYSEIPSTSTDEQLSALRLPAIIHTYFNANVFPDKLEGWGTLMVTSRGGSCTQTVFRNDGCILVRGCNSDGVFSSWHKFTGTALSQTQ